MRARSAFRLLALLTGGMCMSMFTAHAADDPQVSVTLEPAKYVFVDGDAGKFRAQHWMKTGYSGGLKNFSGRFTLPDGTELETQGHALIDAGDLGTELALKKEHVGFFNFDYSEFRKYFDAGAGVYRRFSTLQAPDSDRDLHLNIGKFGFETGLTLERLPELSLAYEREFKNGTKSRLTWPFAKEAGQAQKIAPSWQEIDETVDTFILKGHQEVAGLNLHGEQRWEASRSENFREEDNLATTGVASDTKIRRQNQIPTANLLTTTLGGEGSFLEEKVFISSGYQFTHIKDSEFETLAEYSQDGVLTNYSNPEQEPNNHANSHYDAHSWVENIMVTPWKPVTFGTRLKSEVIKRHSNSTRNHDSFKTSSTGASNAPDGVIDYTDYNLADTKAARWGEAFSVRFSGVPRTALYTDLELEQTRLLLREDEQTRTPAGATVNSTNDNSFFRETVTKVGRGTWTLGGRFDPWQFLDLTTQVRRRVTNTDYDDQRETFNSGSAKSAFFDGQAIHTDEFSTRLTYRPWRWFRPSFRYQLRADKYATRAEGQPIVKTVSLSNIYTFDVTTQPLRDLITTASFSRQTASIHTPADLASAASAQIPTFNADVNTWMFNADYTIKPNITLTGALQYTWANNFNDYSATGQPYGADFKKLDFTTGVTWAPMQLQGTSVSAEYGLYQYNANGNVEVGDYTAHVISFEVTRKF